MMDWKQGKTALRLRQTQVRNENGVLVCTVLELMFVQLV
jgi:hypothetical protein